jgi:hypothetical protein
VPPNELGADAVPNGAFELPVPKVFEVLNGPPPKGDAFDAGAPNGEYEAKGLGAAPNGDRAPNGLFDCCCCDDGLNGGAPDDVP